MNKIKQVSIHDIHPSNENNIYRHFDVDSADDKSLMEDIRKNGINTPLTISNDGFILSGHRRWTAGLLLGLDKIPTIVTDKCRKDYTADEWAKLLIQYNLQREKTLDEVLNEQIVAVEPEEAYQELIAQRGMRAWHGAETVAILGNKERAAISQAKKPFLDAILKVLDDMEDYLPISVRSLHYQLLNNPPLKHASKPGSIYRNNLKSYSSLDELATRARLTGQIPWNAIKDDTRPVQCWPVNNTPANYLKNEIGRLLKTYWRDLMQSQPNHFEIVVEKKTLTDLVERVAREYTIPVISGSGFCSLPPRHEMAERFHKSGKTRLVLILLSDHDPDGVEIAQSFARSMRDDFDIPEDRINLIKAAITPEQIKTLHLIPNMLAKSTSTNYEKFIKLYGKDVFELEAIHPAELTRILKEAIDSVIDHDTYEHEQAKERDDAVFLDGVRQRAILSMKSSDK